MSGDQIPPLQFVWNGDALIPRHPKIADKHLCIGESYCFIEHRESSEASRGHYFATLHDLWMNLPESLAEKHATVEHFRKWCLIKAGYHDQQSFVCSSKAEAVRLAAFLKPIDDFSVVSVNGCAVIRLVAKSQSKRAMGATAFAESKQKVLEIASELVGVTVEQATGAQHGQRSTPTETPTMDREPETPQARSGQESPARGNAEPSDTRPAPVEPQATQGPQEAQGTTDALAWAVAVHQRIDAWRGSPDALKTQWVGEWMADERWSELKANHEGTALALRDAVKAKMEALRAA